MYNWNKVLSCVLSIYAVYRLESGGKSDHKGGVEIVFFKSHRSESCLDAYK